MHIDAYWVRVDSSRSSDQTETESAVDCLERRTGGHRSAEAPENFKPTSSGTCPELPTDTHSVVDMIVEQETDPNKDAI